MADRRNKVRQGLGAVLKSTTERSREPLEEPEELREEPEPEPEPEAEPEPEPEPEPTPRRSPGRPRGRPRSYSTLRPKEEGKRHTSVYLHPAEFDLLDDMIHDLRRQHGIRIPKTELWRALLHLAGAMLSDPERVDDLLAACSSVLEE